MTFGVNSYDWTKGSNGTYYYDKSIPAITESIVESGDVRVYVRATNSNSYQALPYTWFDFSVTRYWYERSHIILEKKYKDSNAEVEDYFFFKVVIIEGEKIESTLNYNNYEEVMDYYNLQENDIVIDLLESSKSVKP